jgi:hypothetical protein
MLGAEGAGERSGDLRYAGRLLRRANGVPGRQGERIWAAAAFRRGMLEMVVADWARFVMTVQGLIRLKPVSDWTFLAGM